MSDNRIPRAVLAYTIREYAAGRGGEVMQSPYTQVPQSKYPGSSKPIIKEKIPDDCRDKKTVIPAALDITRTKEFWQNAVWS